MVLPNEDRYREYVVLEAIGKGSFGQVFLCTHSRNEHEQLVMKCIDIAAMSEEEQIASSQEVSVLKRLNHKYIVKYIDSFMHDKMLCIVMEFCGGGDLQKKIQSYSKLGDYVPEEIALCWIAQITLALRHCHDERILHRDIKPSNVYLMAEANQGRNAGAVRLGDFGVARSLGRTADMASTVRTTN